jgi:hypothetical protein
MNRSKKAFRLIIVRRPYQSKLFDDQDARMKYTAIATTRKGSMVDVLEWYNQRGECSENRIKDLKIGFGMERMPCGQSHANAIFFRIGVFAYNCAEKPDADRIKHSCMKINVGIWVLQSALIFHQYVV